MRSGVLAAEVTAATIDRVRGYDWYEAGGCRPAVDALLDWSLLIPRSSMAEHPTVNRQVAGSNPAAGAFLRIRRALRAARFSIPAGAWEEPIVDVAVVGAAGACGRQSVMQLLSRAVIPHDRRLQLVGNPQGRSAHELWGMRADLRDAFDTWTPSIEVVLNPAEVDADIVVMMAGQTVSADPGQPTDRAALGQRNAEIFQQYAQALAHRSEPPIVVVQSNPVELAVEIFAEELGANRVLSAAGWSDSKRFARELGREFDLPRQDVQAFVVGQHGNFLVPVWSAVTARGIPDSVLADRIGHIRAGRQLADLPVEIAEARTRMLDMVHDAHVREAWEYVESLPADLRACVKPFFTHFTAGRTTEAVTAQAAVDIVEALMHGLPRVFPAQVLLEGQFHGLVGVAAVPVIVGPRGWSGVVDMTLADDEMDALRHAVAMAAQNNAADRGHEI